MLSAVPPPPSDWAAAIASSDLLYSGNDQLVKPTLKATIGNGNVATQIDAETLYIAGVFNGPAAKPFSNSSSPVSHRAAVTSPLNLRCHGEFSPSGAALDLRGGSTLSSSKKVAS